MTREEFLHHFGQVRERTMRVIRCIPRDQMEWTCRKGEFTLGDLVRHIAVTERYVFAECVAGRKSSYSGCGRDLAEGYDAVIALMERLHAESLEIFGKLSDSGLQKKVNTPQGVPITTWKLLRAMIEHEAHHRGQIYVYLGILGVPTPSLYGLNADQLQAASR
jgi:uncharacterized damage-inducible protein DinB